MKIGVDKDGRAINKYVCAPTLRELEDKKTMLRRHYIEGDPVAPDMPFYEYCEQWYTLKKDPFISPASRAAYKVMLTRHILPAFGMRHLRAIAAGELQEFINSFQGVSKSQITLAVGILKAVMRGAYADGIISRDPSVSLIRPKAAPKKHRRALTEDETERVKVTIERHPDGLLLAVLYYLGLRRGEALGLKWGDFDFKELQVHIQRDIDFVGGPAHEGELKTAAANRYIPVAAELAAMLRPLKGPRDSYVFGNEQGKPMSETTFHRRWLSLMEDCGCVELRQQADDCNRPDDIRKRLKATLTPHYFRHNFVTLLHKAHIDPLVAMKMVGHTDYQTTANIYTHLDNETLRKAGVEMEQVFHRKGAGEAGARPAESEVPAQAKAETVAWAGMMAR